MGAVCAGPEVDDDVQGRNRDKAISDMLQMERDRADKVHQILLLGKFALSSLATAC